MGQLKRILVVDDEVMTRNLLFEVLSDQGFKVTLAKDGRDCLNQIKKNRFDLLITDINMPRLDGIEMLKRMKRDKRREKVIVISGMTGDLIDLGRKDILPIFTMLQKPFQINRFLAAVLAVLAGPDKRQKRESRKVRYH